MLNTLIFESGPIMPVLLVTALTGYVLAWERVIVWFWWIVLDRRYFPTISSRQLRERLSRVGPRARGTPLQAVLLRALTYARLPVHERDTRVQEVILGQLSRVDARIATIGWLGSILPMLGLLGTVSGMITTFQALSQSTSRQVLSQGLSEALWTTEVGLLGALPMLAAHHILSRLRERWFIRLERMLALLFTPDRGEHGPRMPQEARPQGGRASATSQVARPPGEPKAVTAGKGGGPREA